MKKFLFLLLLFICSFMITNEKVFANTGNTDNIVIYNYFEEPVKSETSGYISVLMQHVTNGNYVTRNYAWSFVTPNNSTDTPFVNLTVNNNGIKLSFLGFESSFINYDVWWGQPYQYYTYGAPAAASNYYNDEYIMSWSNASYKVIGFIYNGNVNEIVDNRSDKTFIPFTNVWGGSESLLHYQLDVISERLLGIYSSLDISYSQLQKIYQNGISSLDLLENIYTLVDSGFIDVNDKLDDIFDLLENDLAEIRLWLGSIDTELDDIDSDLKAIQEILENFVLDDEPGEGESVDNSSTTSQKDKENALLNKGSANSNTSNVSVELDSTANGAVWGMIDDFINLNPLIMGFFITMLSLGVVRLILNR